MRWLCSTQAAVYQAQATQVPVYQAQSTQAAVYQAQATQPLTQQYSYSTYLQVGLQAQLTQTYATQNIPAPVITPRNKRYRKVTYKYKLARRDINLSHIILASPYRERLVHTGPVPQKSGMWSQTEQNLESTKTKTNLF